MTIWIQEVMSDILYYRMKYVLSVHKDKIVIVYRWFQVKIDKCIDFEKLTWAFRSGELNTILHIHESTFVFSFVNSPSTRIVPILFIYIFQYVS